VAGVVSAVLNTAIAAAKRAGPLLLPLSLRRWQLSVTMMHHQWLLGRLRRVHGRLGLSLGKRVPRQLLQLRTQYRHRQLRRRQMQGHGVARHTLLLPCGRDPRLQLAHDFQVVAATTTQAVDQAKMGAVIRHKAVKPWLCP
jgi:hypothetical protein